MLSKNNIRKAIGEIQLHTIDSVLKNYTDRVGYCMACRGSHLYVNKQNCRIWGTENPHAYIEKPTT